MKIRRFTQFAIKWLTPGIGIKRWLLLLAGGIALLSLGFSSLVRQFYPLPSFVGLVTLQFIPRVPRAILLGVVGLAAVAAALVGINRALLAPFGQTSPETVVNAMYRHHRRGRGPKVVAIGGGHGLAVLLRGLKEHTSNITAIVTVADDGGSSGRLRRELGVLPPGDLRNCIAALADDEALMTQLFQYRFSSLAPRTSADASSLNGHSFGNLFITAMAEVTGSFERAILESGRILAVQGRVLPSTLYNVTLMADLRSEPTGISRVSGQSSIVSAGGIIERVYLEPEDVPAYPESVRALLEADLIVAGPGSLYTSIIPNLLIREITQAIIASHAVKVYVCNVAGQRGETEGYTTGDHIAALEAHVGTGIFPIVLVNSNLNVRVEPPGTKLTPIEFPNSAQYRVIAADLVDPTHPWRHDSEKLARALLRLV